MSSGEYVCGKEGRILIFEKETWWMMRYYTLETAVWNHLQLEYTYNTVNQYSQMSTELSSLLKNSNLPAPLLYSAQHPHCSSWVLLLTAVG